MTDTGYDEEPFCYTCISSGHWQECDVCGGDGLVEDDWDGDGSIHYDFTDCQTCNGRGGWWVCLGSEQHDLEPGSVHALPLDKRPSVAGEA